MIDIFVNYLIIIEKNYTLRYNKNNIYKGPKGLLLMFKLNDTVKKETAYITVWIVILSAVMQSVFLCLGWWNYTVLLGNILGGGAGILNFLLLGITVQKAVTKDEKDAKTFMRGSQSLRTLMLFVIAAIGAILNIFNTWAVLIPLLFPRIAIAISPLIRKGDK